MENLHHILTEDLVAMLSKKENSHLKFLEQVKETKADIVLLKKLIEWRKLTASPIHDSLDSLDELSVPIVN